MAKVIQENGVYVLRDEWSAEDIENVAENIEVTLTEGMILEVMHLLAKHYDSEAGLNYQAVENAIQYVMGEAC